MSSRIAAHRLEGLPLPMRRALVSARRARKWSQVELGRRIGLPQVHISAIESGKVTPRFNTLLDLVRVLDFDLLLVPRALVPAVQSIVRDHGQPISDDDRPLYATDPDNEDGDDA